MNEMEIMNKEIEELLEENKVLRQDEMSEGGVKPDYIILAKTGTKALNPVEKELYIEGLKMGDFFIQGDKKVLGNELVVVPLAFMTVYNEKESASVGARFLGKWSREEALKYPLADSSFFDRILPSGHILTPSNWVVVEVLGHKDLKFAVIAYKSLGSRIWKSWKEDVKRRGGSSATLMYKVFADTYENTKGKWLDINFAYKGNLIEDDKEMAVYCLKKSNRIAEAYNGKTLFQQHALPSPESKESMAEEDDLEDLGF